eukprot:m.241455 g.241455  ORF g.241455 m.241455 type:complete len:317 (+) comp18999_c0_seq6:66-1016(+)
MTDSFITKTSLAPKQSRVVGAIDRLDCHFGGIRVRFTSTCWPEKLQQKLHLQFGVLGTALPVLGKPKLFGLVLQVLQRCRAEVFKLCRLFNAVGSPNFGSDILAPLEHAASSRWQFIESFVDSLEVLCCFRTKFFKQSLPLLVVAFHVFFGLFVVHLLFILCHRTPLFPHVTRGCSELHSVEGLLSEKNLVARAGGGGWFLVLAHGTLVLLQLVHVLVLRLLCPGFIFLSGRLGSVPPLLAQGTGHVRGGKLWGRLLDKSSVVLAKQHVSRQRPLWLCCEPAVEHASHGHEPGWCWLQDKPRGHKPGGQAQASTKQ